MTSACARLQCINILDIYAMCDRHHFISAVLLTLAALMMSGCILEDTPEYGDKCPPISGHTLSYIVGDKIYSNDGIHWNESYASQYCPKDYPSCAIDSSGQYYCMASCPDSQIGCDGKCINPMTDPDYCGATTNDSVKFACQNYLTCQANQTCTLGKCIDKTCNNTETRCINGRMEECIDMQWHFIENCATGECQSDWSCAASHCTNNDSRCTHNRYETCVNGSWITTLTCQPGFSCVKTLGCVSPSACTTTFAFYDPWTALKSGGKADFDVYLVGSFNVEADGTWKQTDPTYKMTADGNGMHTIAVEWPIGSNYEYKYYVNGWANDSWKTDAPDGISNGIANITSCDMKFGAQAL